MSKWVDFDQWTKAGHAKFKATRVFDCSDGKVRTWEEWMDWQAHRDPIAESPAKAEEVRKRLYKKATVQRGPGISRR